MRSRYIIILLIILIGCKVQYSITGHEYVYDGNNRRLSVEVVDDTWLIIRNYYNCQIDERYKNIEFKKRYVRYKDNIIIKTPVNNIEFPYINDTACFFLSKEYRESIDSIFDGRTYYPNKSLYTIPDIDTIKILPDGDLMYYKKHKKGSYGYIFKKNTRAEIKLND